jgi:hypothetical protein
MNIQHVNVKVFAETAAIDLGSAIPVFHRWIQDEVCEELLVDVADYRHVPGGPGVILIGHEANYSLDWGPAKRLGLLYNRKASLEGSTQEKLNQGFEAALEACRRLEEDPVFERQLRFNRGDCEVTLNDRLLTPNTEETWQALKPEFEAFFARRFGSLHFDFERSSETRERFAVRVRKHG